VSTQSDQSFSILACNYMCLCCISAVSTLSLSTALKFRWCSIWIKKTESDFPVQMHAFPWHCRAFQCWPFESAQGFMRTWRVFRKESLKSSKKFQVTKLKVNALNNVQLPALSCFLANSSVRVYDRHVFFFPPLLTAQKACT